MGAGGNRGNLLRWQAAWGYKTAMIARLTERNQLTLPAELVATIDLSTRHFDAEVVDGRIVLTPVPRVSWETIQSEVAEAGVTEQDVAEAVAWVRKTSRPS